MNIVSIIWRDAAETFSGKANELDQNPLMTMRNIGILIGEFVDSNGDKYVKLCHKQCIDYPNSDNDDYICILSSSIKKIDVIGKID